MAIGIRDYRHGGTSSPVQNGWHRNGTPASVSLLRGPNRGEWPGVGAGSADFVPSWDRYASVKNTQWLRENSGCPTATCDGAAAAPANTSATPASLLSAKAILRDQRRRDLIASIAEWERASGPDRVWWRRQASWLIGQWRSLHQAPERAAFQAAVARSRA